MDVTGLTGERLAAMYAKFSEISGSTVSKEKVSFGESRMVKMSATIPEILVGLGVVKDEREGDMFLKILVTGTLMGHNKGIMGMEDTLFNLVKLGYVIGLAANKVTAKGEN
jgi:hypothetical protein